MDLCKDAFASSDCQEGYQHKVKLRAVDILYLVDEMVEIREALLADLQTLTGRRTSLSDFSTDDKFFPSFYDELMAGPSTVPHVYTEKLGLDELQSLEELPGSVFQHV